MKLLFEVLLTFFPMVGDYEIHPQLPSNTLPVPLLEQETDYSCGAAALLALLQYWQNYSGTEESLYELLLTKQEFGTLPENIARGGLSFGLQAKMISPLTLDDLREHLKNGETLILELQAWRDSSQKQKPWNEIWDSGHYVILVALDQNFAYFSDPSVSWAYTYMPLTELMDRWHDINEIRRFPAPKKDFQLVVSVKGAEPPQRPLPSRHLIRLE